MNVFENKKAVYHTLGCKLNFAETSSIGSKLKALGVGTAEEGEIADICIVNTCSVTEVADSKCRQAIRMLVRHNPGALVVVTGCYAQLSPAQVAAIEGVDVVVGSNEKARIVEIIAERLQTMPKERLMPSEDHPSPEEPDSSSEPDSTESGSSAKGHGTADVHTVRTADIRTFMPSCSCGDRTRYFLKVQDGCDYYCTYCTIPYARGRSRNGSIEMLVGQAREVARAGAKEIVITGVNIGDFGKTTGESFLDLLKALDGVEGIERYRISSIEPNLLTDEVIAFCAQSRTFVPHFHIPLQSGSDEVLRLMHRHYDTAFFRSKIESVLELMPDAFIGVDTIVGARGETEELFRESYSFMKSLPVAQYHVFHYSERPGTMALKIPHCVSPHDKKERAQKVLQLSDEKLHEFYRQNVGTVRPVLFEHNASGRVLHGFTDNYIRVEIDVPEGVDADSIANTIVDVRLGEWNADGTALKGELCR